MSKAFTREDDQVPERLFVPKLPPVPYGVKNYITADGAARLQHELAELEAKRPTLLPGKNDPTIARELELLDQRLATIAQILGSVTVVEPAGNLDKVKFGSWVRVRNRVGETEVYRISGIHETDLGDEWISWISPLAKALLNSGVGDKVKIKLPKGMEELEILEIKETTIS